MPRRSTRCAEAADPHAEATAALADFYATHNPPKVAHAGEILSSRSREQLTKELHARYGVVPVGWAVPPPQRRRKPKAKSPDAKPVAKRRKRVKFCAPSFEADERVLAQWQSRR